MFPKRKKFPVAVLLLILAVCASIAVILAIMLPVRGGDIQLPVSETFGILAIDIDENELQSAFHVSQKGVYVLSVEDDSPAEEAGILSGDRIVSVNDIEPASASDFVTLCSQGSSSKTSITIERESENEQLTVEFNSDLQ